MVTRLRIGDLPPDQRPRERLQRIGGEALTDAEVVAILVGSGNSGANAIDVAQKALVQLGGIAGLIRADNDALQRVPGIGPSSAAKILAGAELHRRAERAKRPTSVGSSADIAELVIPEFAGHSHERIVVVVLSAGLTVLDVVTLANGIQAEASIATAEVIRAVLSRGGSAFALAHNHPGGSMVPSRADATSTEVIRAAASTCGLRFLDHLVVADSGWFSVND